MARNFSSPEHPKWMRRGCAAPARRADKWRESAVPVLKGLLRIRRYHQQETPYALQEVERIPWIQFGEAYSALRGWRPIPAALLSHSVLLCSGTEDNSLPTLTTPNHREPHHSGKKLPLQTPKYREENARCQIFRILAVEIVVPFSCVEHPPCQTASAFSTRIRVP